MKINMSLKTKITLLITLIILSVAVVITTISIRNANTYFVTVSKSIDTDKYGEASVDDDSNVNTNFYSEKSEEINFGNQQYFYNGYKTDDGAENEIVTEVSNQFTNKSIIYMLIIIVIGIAISYVLLSKWLKPLKELDKAVKNINENNLSNKITNIKTNDEIGNLVKSFNIMLDRLSKSFNSQKQFTSNAAHELKTPLAIMKSSIDVLKLDEKPKLEDYEENLEYMKQSTKSLIRIVDDLLNLTRNSNGYFDEIVLLYNIIDKVVEQLDALIKEKNICINMEKNKCTIAGNEGLLYHVFFNIIENAIKYNTYGGRINISILKERDKARVSISDSGIGMSAEEVENIFEPFYCIDKSRSKENGGYGLGLSIVKSIIEKQNGEIHVTSEINKGTKFELIL